MTDDSLSLDTIHELLAARYRRYLLYCLYLYSNPMKLSDVTERITEWECDPSGDQFIQKREETWSSLYHIHVPKLTDANVVLYNSDENMLELGPNASQFRVYLEYAADAELDIEEAVLL